MLILKTSSLCHQKVFITPAKFTLEYSRHSTHKLLAEGRESPPTGNKSVSIIFFFVLD